MAQNPHIVDLRRSYLPIDPDLFPPTMHATEGEDAPESRVPVIPYDGFNFMPTPQGYVSFFGTNSRLGVDALTGNVDYIFTIQKNTLVNLAVALKDSGIWTKDLASGGAWTQVITLAVPAVGVHKNWSKCVIDQTIYVYRQGEASVWKANAANSYVFTAFTPTFLNMAGQIGIFKAGSRLGFWDSENSISWSSLDNTQDITPSISTLAGNTIFQDIVGKIVNVLQHGTGFIVYCTRSIVHVSRTVDSPMLFSGKAIFNSNGISYRDEACFGDPDIHHFAMTTAGFCEITNGQAQFISPEASTYFKKQREPFYLQVLNNRYLFLQFFNPDYLRGRTDFSITNTASTALTFQAGDSAADSVTSFSGGADVNQALYSVDRNHRSIHLYDTSGYDDFGDASTPAEVPIMEDHFATVVALAELAAYVASAPTTLGDSTYFAGKTVTTENIFGVSTNKFPALQANLTTAQFRAQNITAQMFVEANANDFWEKQNFLWDLEKKYLEDYFTYLQGTFNTSFITQVRTSTSNNRRVFANTSGALTGNCGVTYVWNLIGEEEESQLINPASTQDFDFGGIDLRYYTNKMYGWDGDTQWIQKSFPKLFRVYSPVTVEMVSPGGIAELGWNANGVFGFGETTGDNDLKNALAAALVSLQTSGYEATYMALLADSIANIAAFCTGIGSLSGVSVTFDREVSTNENFEYYLGSGGEIRRLWGIRAVVYKVTATIGGNQGSAYIVFCPVTGGAGSTSFINAYRPQITVTASDHLKEHLLAGNPVFGTSTGNVRFHFGNIVETPITPDMSLSALLFAGIQPKILAYTQVTGHGHYTDPNTFVVDDGNDEAPTYDDFYIPTPPPTTASPAFNGVIIVQDPWQPDATNGGGSWAGHVNDLTINSVSYNNPAIVIQGTSIVIPSGTILLQAGSIEPIYPTFRGAFVFDIHYRKWGKMGLDYKNLLDIWPINTMAGEGIFPYDSFLPKIGCRKEDGTLPIFDEYPASSEIVFGKIGFYRKGFTDLEEVLVQHGKLQNGILKVEASIDGRNVDATLTDERTYQEVASMQEGYSLSARWFNLIFTGFFDLIGLEARGYRAGKR